MEIEVRQDDGLYAKARIQKISEANVIVSYPNQWKQSEEVSYDRIRAVLTESQPKCDFKRGETFEAYFKKGNQPTEMWQEVKLRDNKVRT
jgi:hypothetical protein